MDCDSTCSTRMTVLDADHTMNSQRTFHTSSSWTFCGYLVQNDHAVERLDCHTLTSEWIVQITISNAFSLNEIKSNWQQVRTGSGNGLVSYKCQTIVWFNDDLVSLIHICITRTHYTKTVWVNIDGLMQERCNSIANTLELRLSCINPSMSSLITPLNIVYFSRRGPHGTNTSCPTTQNNFIMQQRTNSASKYNPAKLLFLS